MTEQTGGRPDLSAARRIHLIGAGGAGMSAIAAVLLAMGHRVSGSDAVASPALERVASLGAVVHVGHDPTWLEGAEVVARSSAIPDDNAEVVTAKSRGLVVWRRSELLAAVCAQRRTVAVSGTHGKTTTSSMLLVVLREAGLHPSMIIGGDVAGIGSGAEWDPRGEWLVVEADESDGTFLELGAEAVVVTSVEPDHLDFYGSEAAMRDAFVRFVANASGPVVVCIDDAVAAAIVSGAASAGSDVRTYGTSDAADARISDASSTRSGSEFVLHPRGRQAASVSLQVPGLHNARNATAALSMADALGVPWEAGIAAVARFKGVARRFELRGERDGITFVDDYGHLPAEVAATVSAAVAGKWERVVAVFQPHRYSRTEALWQEFADSFAGSDVVVITDVYPAGEKPRAGVSGELIAGAVRSGHPGLDVRYVPSIADLPRELDTILRPGDLCLTMGAGDLTNLPGELLAEHRDGHG